MEKEYKPFEFVRDHFPKYVLSLDDAFDTSLKGVRWMNIMEFLLKE